MSDFAEVGRALTELRKERHITWKQRNFDAIKAAGMRYTITNNGLCMLFREPGKPAVDFFPTTGRWRSQGKTYRGQAVAFLAWYAASGSDSEGGTPE